MPNLTRGSYIRFDVLIPLDFKFRGNTYSVDFNFNEYVLIECKGHLFSIQSSSAKQARALLLQCGEQFNTALKLPSSSTPDVCLLNTTEHLSALNYSNNLCKIRDELNTKGFLTLPIGAIGLMHENNHIFIVNSYQHGKVPEEIKNKIANGIKVIAIENDENCISIIPLFYIPQPKRGFALKLNSNKAKSAIISSITKFA